MSLGARGIFDICFVFRDTVRTVSDMKLPEKSQEWRKHFDAADVKHDVDGSRCCAPHHFAALDSFSRVIRLFKAAVRAYSK